MTCHAGDKAISNFRDQYVSNLRINLTRNHNVRTSLHNYRRKIFERHLVYDLPIFNCMSEHSTTDLKKALAQCTCTHPTHFLGRCKKLVDAPEHMCAECMQDHFSPMPRVHSRFKCSICMRSVPG